MTRQEKTPSVASARPRRSPLVGRNRLAVRNQKPGFVYRIVNDMDDNVVRRQEQGYEVATAEEIGPVGDKRVDNITSPGSAAQISVGQGTKAVVMRIPEDWYKEDQAAKQAEIDALEQTMKKDNSDYGDISIRR